MTITRATLALATLAAVGLAAQPAAHAQSLTLQSGDAVTVSGVGTQGTIGGQPVNNATTSYTSGGGSIAGVQTNGTAIFTLAAGATLIGDGGGIAGGAALEVNGSGPVTVSGGTFIAAQQGAIGVFAGQGVVTITGGIFPSASDDIGLVTPGGTINLFSQNDTPFLINGVPMNNTALPASSSGTISGILLDGEQLNTTFTNTFVYGNGTINLNIGTPPLLAPEPSQFAALAIGILGLGALALRARRRHARA